MKKQMFFAFVFLLSIDSGFVAHADITKLSNKGKCPAGPDLCIRVSGSINLKDLNIVNEILNTSPRRKKQTFFIYLDSLGGDLGAAIRIGRLLRETEDITPLTIITSDSECTSSCVFLLAAGKERIVDGRVGIHRPFLSDTNERDYKDLQSMFRNLESTATRYLRDMNIPDRLYDDMMRIDPEHVRYLSALELDEYGLTHDDPVQKELEDAKTARKYGLSKEEYLERKRLIDEICNSSYQETKNTSDWISCRDRILKLK